MAEKLITVRAVGETGRVVLWERDTRHPNGEVFLVAGNPELQVARTKRVESLMKEGKLVEAKATSTSVPELRPATDAEEDAAGLTTTVEKTTARVPKDKD